MNKLIMTLLVACTFAAKAPLPFEDKVKIELAGDCLHFRPAFQKEMGYLFTKLNEKNNQQARNAFIHAMMTFYIQCKSIYPITYLNENAAPIFVEGMNQQIDEKEWNDNDKQFIKSFFTLPNPFNSDEILDNFIQHPNRFMQAAIDILHIQGGTAYRERWASKLFAMFYLLSFCNLDGEETARKMHKIANAFKIRANHLAYNPNYFLV